MAPHTGSATPEQINALLNFLDEHRDLARGRLRSVEGKVQAKRLWEEISNNLNSMGGCTKTVQQWQKVWFDRKHLSKKAAAESRRSASATGGGPATAPQLSAWELKVLSIMGDGFGERQTGARVPAFPENREPTPSISSQPDIRFYDNEPEPASEPISVSQPIVLDFPEQVVEFVEPSQDGIRLMQHAESASQPVSQEFMTSRRCSQPTRRRRRQSAADTDVRSRLFQIEEQRLEINRVRNTELAGIRAALLEHSQLITDSNREFAGIRAALLELCGLVREYLNR